MKKNITIISVIIIVLFSCSYNKYGINNPIVQDNIDSIRKYCTREIKLTHEKYEFVYLDEECWGERRKQWIFADSIDKYCSIEDLKSLATKHESNTIRIVAFQLLMKRNQHEASQILISNINNNDTIGCGRLDQVLENSMSGIMAQVIFDPRHNYYVSKEDSLAIDRVIRNSSAYDYYKLHIEYTGNNEEEP